MENVEIKDISEFFNQICKLCKEYVTQQLNKANWPIPKPFETPSDPKRACLICKLSNLNGDLLVFKDLKFVELIHPNSDIDFEKFNPQQFDLNLLLKALKIDFERRVIALQNELFNFEDLSFSSSKLVPLGFDFFVILNLIANSKNHNNFKNLIQINFLHSITNNFTIHSSILNNNNCTTTTNNNYKDNSNEINKDNKDNGNEDVKIIGKDVMRSNLKEVVLGIFLRELERLGESKLMNLFNKVCQDKLLMEQLSRIKINVNFEPNFENQGNNFQCTLHISRDVITFTGYYNKFSRNISQTPWLIDNQKINNIERCIGLPLKLLCKGSSYKLISCGREDVNVRNLGIGRRVSIEVSNCKIDLFLLFFLLFKVKNNHLMIAQSSHSNFNNIIKCNNEKEITCKDIIGDDKLLKYYFTNSIINNRNNNSSITNNSICKNRDNKEVIKFKNIRIEINNRKIRKEMQKKSEMNKKRYNCLVFSENEMEVEKVRLLESKLEFPLKIKQKNPIRISHRRAQDERPKMIFKLKLNLINQRLMLVDVITEAGVYVKEFVNGDLGRSRPSLATMLGAGQLRLLFLDVVSSDFEIGHI